MLPTYAFQLPTPQACRNLAEENPESQNYTAVVLPIADYERLMEDLGDYAVIADRRKEPTIPHEQFVSELKQDGTLPS